MMRFFPVLLLCLAVPVSAQEMISCILRPSAEIEIAPPVAGLLESLSVDRGDRVDAGQELGRVFARVEEAQLEAARRRAESTAAIDSRRAQLADAERRLEQMESLRERGVASQNQLDEVLAEVSIARSQVAEAEDSRFAAQLEVVAAEAALDQRVITSPVAGVVLARHVDPGEFAAADEALLEIVSVDTLHAEIVLPDRDYGMLDPGQTVGITSGSVDRSGQIDAIDPIIDAASRSFSIRVVVENADGGLTAGARCDTRFE